MPVAKKKSGKKKVSAKQKAIVKVFQNPETETAKKLTDKEKLFCQLYVTEDFFGNGIQAYAEAYDVDLSKKYGVAKTGSSRLLTDVDVLHYIDEIMEATILNDQLADRETAFLMVQKADLHAKAKGIELYRKVKGQIQDKLKITGTIDWNQAKKSKDMSNEQLNDRIIQRLRRPAKEPKRKS